MRNVDGDTFEVHLLGSDLTRQTTLISRGMWSSTESANFELVLLLKEGSILQVVTSGGKWSFQTVDG